MILVSFLVGCIAGLLSAAAILLFTDMGWSSVLIAYFGIGYGLPVAVVTASMVSKLLHRGLQTLDFASR